MFKLNWDKKNATINLNIYVEFLFSSIVKSYFSWKLPWVFANPEPHDKQDCCNDQTELYDEGVEVGGGLGHDVPHQVDPPARKVVELDCAVHPELGVLISLLQQVVAI